jgi:hypothetical protein
VVVPSFRFKVPEINKNVLLNDSGVVKVLVALPISERHIKTVADLIGSISSGDSPIQFLIKKHPASEFSIDDNFVNKNNIQYIPVNEPLHKLFDEVDLFLSIASSTLVEAVMHGVPVILASSRCSLRENVIPDFVPNELWSEVYSSEELNSVLMKYKRSASIDIDKIKKLNSKIIGIKPNKQNVSQLLGLLDS